MRCIGLVSNILLRNVLLLVGGNSDSRLLLYNFMPSLARFPWGNPQKHPSKNPYQKHLALVPRPHPNGCEFPFDTYDNTCYHTRMPQLNLKPNHKAIRDYYATLQQYDRHDITHEGAVSNPFAFLLDACAKQTDATLVPQYPMRTPAGNRIVLDGVILDAYRIPFAYWEAKDMDDDLHRAVQEKRECRLSVRQYPLPKPAARYPLSERRTGL